MVFIADDILSKHDRNFSQKSDTTTLTHNYSRTYNKDPITTENKYSGKYCSGNHTFKGLLHSVLLSFPAQ